MSGGCIRLLNWKNGRLTRNDTLEFHFFQIPLRAQFRMRSVPTCWHVTKRPSFFSRRFELASNSRKFLLLFLFLSPFTFLSPFSLLLLDLSVCPSVCQSVCLFVCLPPWRYLCLRLPLSPVAESDKFKTKVLFSFTACER